MSINSKMTALANAIRKKTGGTAALTLDGMATGLNNIPDNDASDVTVSGATVSIPKGNYLEDVSKSVTNQGTKTATLNTSTTSYTIPAGYHSGSGKVSITLEEKSATPSTSAQTITPTSGKVLSKVTVASIPSDYVPSGYVKPTATLAAKTYTPSTSSQTIAAGTYLSGVQTISAVPTQSKSATPSTSTQTITPDTGKFLSSVSVAAISTETKTATPNTSTQTITPTSGKFLSKVTVNAIPSNYADTSTLTDTTNGTNTDPSHVLVGKQFIGKSGTIEEGEMPNSTASTTLAANGSYTIPAGYHDGTGKVTQSLTNRSPSNLTVSGATVTAPAGYYASSASKSVATATQATPTVSIDTTNHTATASVIQSTGYVTGGTKTASATIPTETKSVTPKTSAQDVTPTSGKYLTKVSVGAISTQTKSATPTTSSQTIKPDSGKYLSSVTVGAIPSTYVKPSATKAAATITPGTTNQTIAAGTYLSGAQTIAGDADLVSANIKAGANIFGVAGNANVVDTSAGTAVAGDMLSGKIAFVDGAKVTGTIESISVDGYGSAGGGHHTSQTAYFGAYTEGDSASYFYAFVPQYSYTGINSLIRIPAQNAQEAVGLEANDQIAAGSTVFGIEGASPIPVALLMSAAATSGTGGTSTARGMMIDESFGSIDGGVFTASRAGTYYVASTYLGNTKFGSGSYQGNSYTAVNNSSGTSVANKSVTLSSGGTITITGTASKSSSSNTNGGSVAARAVVIYYTGR